MNAIRQHFLPRFLLKGFASRELGREIYTWVYQGDRRVFETNIKNVGTEKHFYGHSGENSVDEKITAEENEYAQLIEKLRGTNDPSPVDDISIPYFITHLSIRTRNIRDSFAQTATHVIDSINSSIFNPGTLKKLLAQNQPLIRAEIEKALEHLSLPRVQRQTFVDFLLKLASSETEEQQEFLESMMQPFFETAQTVIPKSIKEGQIKALSQSVAPAPRAADYQNLKWYVRRANTDLILGDSGCFFEIDEKKGYRPLNDRFDTIRHVYLPISTNRMLVGCAEEAPPELDEVSLNNAAASCSRDFFIGNKQSTDWIELQTSVRKTASLLSQDDVDQMLNDWLPSID